MKKLFVLLLVVGTVLSGCSLINPLKDVKVGDIIEYGTYEQDNDKSNGKEPIEWQVLAKENNRILVISKYCLDVKPYNDDKGNDLTYWKVSSLRRWLNDDFIDLAFTAREESRISLEKVKADVNPESGTISYVDTYDEVFLLSMQEVEKYFGVLPDRKENTITQAKATPYAVSKGARGTSEIGYFWWLRSPGNDYDHATCVNADGSYPWYPYADSGEYAVRPAMWISTE